MNGLTNIIQNKDLTALTHKAPHHVVNAIAQASGKTGVDFAYLLQQAKTESNFDSAAKAGSSSAQGLYQFIERTWLGMVKEHGDKYGLGDLADQIDSRYRVKDHAVRKQILDLRNDPVISSQMAAEFALENEQTLDKLWGGEVGSTELYLAHFLGAGGAASFLNARDESPLAPAADLFPKAARANRNVFYDSKSGKARSVEEVYQFFDKKFQIKGVPSDPSSFAVARAPGGTLPGAVQVYPPSETAFYSASVPAPQSGGIYSFDEYRSLYQNRAAAPSLLPSLPSVPNLPPLPAKPMGAGASIVAQPGGLRSYQSMMTNPVDLMILSQSDLNPAHNTAEERCSGDKGPMNG